jgi:hypothetical protein
MVASMRKGKKVRVNRFWFRLPTCACVMQKIHVQMVLPGEPHIGVLPLRAPMRTVHTGGRPSAAVVEKGPRAAGGLRSPAPVDEWQFLKIAMIAAAAESGRENLGSLKVQLARDN